MESPADGVFGFSNRYEVWETSSRAEAGCSAHLVFVISGIYAKSSRHMALTGWGDQMASREGRPVLTVSSSAKIATLVVQKKRSTRRVEAGVALLN